MRLFGDARALVCCFQMAPFSLGRNTLRLKTYLPDTTLCLEKFCYDNDT
jgi:hypothetical protein